MWRVSKHLECAACQPCPPPRRWSSTCAYVKSRRGEVKSNPVPSSPVKSCQVKCNQMQTQRPKSSTTFQRQPLFPATTRAVGRIHVPASGRKPGQGLLSHGGLAQTCRKQKRGPRWMATWGDGDGSQEESDRKSATEGEMDMVAVGMGDRIGKA